MKRYEAFLIFSFHSVSMIEAIETLSIIYFYVIFRFARIYGYRERVDDTKEEKSDFGECCATARPCVCLCDYV